MSEKIFKKNMIYRISAYILLLPFIPAVRPILNHHETTELVLFISGFLMTIALVIFSNRKPYIKASDENLMIHLMHRHKPEIHKINSIERVTVKSERKVILYSKGFDPLEIRLNKKEILRLLSYFEEKEIPISKVYRNS